MQSQNFLADRYKLHEQFMLKILHGLFSTKVAPYLAFKGGTLAYFCYDLERYSTDIDLDLLDHSREEEVKSEIIALLSRIGEIKNITLGRDLHRWIFRYDEKSPNIKVELNKRELTGNSYEYQTIFGQDIYCVDALTMVTNKFLALGNRRYNRDLFDTHFFRKKGFEYKEEIIFARSGMSLPDYIEFLIKELPKHYASNTILADGMGDVLTDTQKLRVKKHLATETIALLDQYLQKNK
ncbi:MAG: nucleotidyl transferase AbiEii/AbiGii toxin family protein [Candidatus Absconditicoccaceae bacterium]